MAATDDLLVPLAQEDERVPILMHIPGAMSLQPWLSWPSLRRDLSRGLSLTIGDVAHLASPKKLSSYAGLVPSLHRSGQKNTTGPITKAGRSHLRWVMVEAAHVAGTLLLSPQSHKGHQRGHCPQDAGHHLASAERRRRLPWPSGPYDRPQDPGLGLGGGREASLWQQQASSYASVHF